MKRQGRREEEREEKGKGRKRGRGEKEFRPVSCNIEELTKMDHKKSSQSKYIKLLKGNIGTNFHDWVGCFFFFDTVKKHTSNAK